MHQCVIRVTARRFALLCCTSLCLGTAHAAPPLSFAELPAVFDLPLAYRLALAHDRGYAVAQAQAAAAQEALPQALARQRPSIGYSSSRTRISQQRRDENLSYAPQTYLSQSDTLQLKQPIYNRRLDATEDQARASLAGVDASLQAERQALGVKVAQAYYNLLLAQSREDLIRVQLHSLGTRLDGAQKAFAAGTGIRTDVDELRAQLDLLNAQALGARQAIANARTDLEVLVGVPFVRVAPVQPAQFAPQRVQPGELRDWSDRAMAESAEVRARQAQLESAEAALRATQADHLPTLDLVAQLSRSSSDNSFFVNSVTQNKAVGVQLNVPIYQGGYLSSRDRQAAANVEEARAQLERVRNGIRVDVLKAHSAVREGLERIAALEKAVASAAQVVLASQQSFKAGLRTTLDIVAAEQREAQARLDLSEAQLSLLAAWAKLKSLVGEVETAL
ncbi:TolC Outer membrane protein [Burkholderiales bacterium]